MNPDYTHDRKPEDDAALLTAHALGQLDGREREELLSRLARPDAESERQIVDETRRIAEALEAGHVDALHSSEAPGRSQHLRRTIIATLAATSAAANARPAGPNVIPPGPKARRLHGPWGLLAMAGSLAAAVLVIVTVLNDSPQVAIGDFAEHARQKPAPAIPATEKDAVNFQAAGKAPAEASAPAAPSAPSAPSRVAAPAFGRELADHEGGRIGGGGGVAKGKSGDPFGPSDSRRRDLQPSSPSDGDAAARDNEAGQQLALAAKKSADGRGKLALDLPGGTPAVPGRMEGAAAGRYPSTRMLREEGRETYERLQENRKLAVSDQPLSTFSIDVDTASYANVRRFLSSGRLPPRDAVRIEELVNYFRYDDPKPDGDAPFSVAIESAASPWHDGRLIVRIGLKGREIDRTRRPAGNLVFLIDSSGSMQEPDKLPLVKQAVAMLVGELTENDRVSIVTYAGDAGLVLPPTTGDQKQRILAAIEGLRAGGSTNGSAGIELAYDQAAEYFIEGGVNRVILATDGDLNVGVTSDAALVELIKRKAAGGTFLTVLGFGQGNLQDAKMEKIADNGNGIYAYIDGVREARKVLVEQLTGSTITIAKDVKIQVEFNPATVASYRLIGYENRLLAARDFRDDRKDAGEIGAGHSVTALYEIVPVGGPPGDIAASGDEPLKYQPQPERAATAKPAAAAKPAAIDAAFSRELLTVKLRFKKPDGRESVLREFPLGDRGGDFEAASADLRFAAAVATFGMILRGSDQTGSATLDDVARIAGHAIGHDDGGYRAEFLDLVRKAGSLGITADP